MYRVHYYDTSEAAYDACLNQSPCIQEGDVLAILSEGVIGLASLDPIALTIEAGALRRIPTMSGPTLLDELAHDADQLRHGVETALRHHLPVEPHFLAFVEPVIPYPHAQIVVALTFNDILVSVDAITHRIATLERRLDAVESESAHALFLRRAVDQLATARTRLQRHRLPHVL